MITLVFATFLLLNSIAKGQFIRNTEVYYEIIRGIQTYFRNTNIILFYGMENIGFQDQIFLWELQNSLHNSNSFTLVMDFRSFNKTIADNFNNVVNPLFVLLNNNEIVQDHLIWVSQWMIMSTYSTWLLFVEEDTLVEGYLKNVYISIDSTFLITKQSKTSPREEVKCAYNVEKIYLHIKKFASWTKETGLTDFTKVLYEKTKNFDGKVLRVSSLQLDPVTVLIRDKRDKSTIIGLMGFYGELVKTLCGSLNIRPTYKEAFTWGAKENGSFTGAIGSIERNEVDLLGLELAMTPDRSEVTNSLIPHYQANYLLIIKKPTNTNIKWTAYLAPFTATTWIAIALMVLAVSLSICFTNKAFTKLMPEEDSYVESSDSFLDILLEIFGSFCSQGIQPSKINAVRSMHFLTHLTAITVLAAYSAALISFLTTQTLSLPFTTMEGLAQDKTYKMGVIHGTADHTLLKTTKKKVLRTLYDKYLTADNPKNIHDGLRRVCKDGKFAFMIIEHWGKIFDRNLSCTLQTLDVAWTRNVALQTTRSNPFREALNRLLCKMRSSGILQRMYEHDLLAGYIPQPKEKVFYKPVDMNDILPLLLFFVVGLISSCLILLVENSLFLKFHMQMKNLLL